MMCNDLSEIVSWTSASGLARSLYVNKAAGKGLVGGAARVLIVLLLLIPLVLGLAEITLGIIFRHQEEGCSYPLPVWVIVDGCAALLTAVLSLVDIARVQALSGDEEELDAEGEEDDSAEARKRRTKALGTYACTGLTVIFLLPLFRLIWLMLGLDGLYRIDPKSFSTGTTFFSGPLNPGQCNPTLYTFAHYYIETATLIVLLVLIFLLLATALILCSSAQSISFGWCCGWCCCRGSTGRGSSQRGGQGSSEQDEEERLLKTRQLLREKEASQKQQAAPEGTAILFSTGVAGDASANGVTKR